MLMQTKTVAMNGKQRRTLKMTENYDNIKRIAEELRTCACSWEPNAKLFGNVSAKDIEYLCDYIIYNQAGTPE